MFDNIGPSLAIRSFISSLWDFLARKFLHWNPNKSVIESIQRKWNLKLKMYLQLTYMEAVAYVSVETTDVDTLPND